MSNLCIIPARGGSKRIPRKNIRDFHGKPIIAYTIEAAISSNIFDEIIVSTDDEEIGNISIKYGAKVPFYRSEKNSSDFATTVDVIKEVIEYYQTKKLSFDNICCCYPTAPFISGERLIEGFQKLKNKNINTVFPILEFSYPVLRSLNLDENNMVSMNWPEHLNSRSQDLPKAYHDAGQWYWIKSEKFIKTNKIIGQNSFGLILKELEAQDIDNETDWKLAELKYELLQNIK